DHHRVRLENLRVLVAHGALHSLLEILKLRLRLVERFKKPIDLGRHLVIANGNAINGRFAPLDDHGAADSNARRNADPFVRTDGATGGGSESGSRFGEHEMRL